MASHARSGQLTPAAALARLGLRARGRALLLRDGPVSRSYRVDLRGAGAAVLRIDHPAPGGGTRAAALGLDRDREHRLLAALARDGLAPAPLAVDAAAGVALRVFLPGPTWADARAPSVPAMAAALARVHRWPIPQGLLPERDWRATLARYATLAGQAGASALAEAEVARSELPASGGAKVNCHHDPLPGNGLRRDGVWLDWEYAALGNPLFDIAVLGLGLGLPAHGQGARWQRLVDAYAGAGGVVPASDARRDLPAFTALVRAVGNLWIIAVTGLSSTRVRVSATAGSDG